MKINETEGGLTKQGLSNATRKTWKEFRESKLLWWVNRTIHVFGWSIVVVAEDDGTISDAYPARVKFRGFSEDSEEAGFTGVTKYLRENISELEKDLDIK